MKIHTICKKGLALGTTLGMLLAATLLWAHDYDNNPPGPAGGVGTNWENPPGPAGGPGTSPNRHDKDNNPPGLLGGPGTNWENPPGPAGGPGTSPNRPHPIRRYCRHHASC